MSKSDNITSRDEDGNIIVNGEFKVCNIPVNCSGSRCDETCVINQIIKRLYKFEYGEIYDE